MPQMTALAVGQRAPEFRLRGPAGQQVALSEYRNHQAVVLLFYPLAFTPLCSHELPELEAMRPGLEALGATVIGISVDSWQANEVFARQLGVRFPLLSDFRREVSRAYGVLDENRYTSGRALFVIDRDGLVVHAEVAGDAESAAEVPGLSGVVRVIEAMAR